VGLSRGCRRCPLGGVHAEMVKLVITGITMQQRHGRAMANSSFPRQHFFHDVLSHIRGHMPPLARFVLPQWCEEGVQMSEC
jgi:hypothetical protein